MKYTLDRERVESLLSGLEKKYPKFKIGFRGDDLHEWWHFFPVYFLALLTKVSSSYGRYTIQVGYSVYFPESHKTDDIIEFLRNISWFYTLKHEVKHIEQMERERHMYVFWLKYLLFPLPILWTFRFDYELEAYGMQMLRDKELYGYVREETVDFIVKQLTTYRYFFASVGTRSKIEDRARYVSRYL